MKKTIFILLFLSLLWGCSSDRTGNFKLYLTDQPIANAEQILVTVSEIRVQKTEEAFLSVYSGSQTYDLLKLQNKEEMIATAELEQGKYTQIRLAVTAGQVVVDGVSHEMTIPSSEIKIPVVFDIVKDGVTEIVLDFEAEHSIQVVKAGLNEEYILRPVVKVKEIRY